MIKDVIHDPILLAIKSEKATIEDLQVADAFVCQFSTNDATKNGDLSKVQETLYDVIKR